MFNPEDFVFTIGGPEPEGLFPDIGFQLGVATLGQLPALEGQGISMAIVNLDACSILPPHYQPRAAEMSRRAEVIVAHRFSLDGERRTRSATAASGINNCRGGSSCCASLDVGNMIVEQLW